MADDSTAISSSISDERIEKSYAFLDTSTGLSRTATVVEFPTVDDLMLLGMQAVAAEIGLETPYESIMNKETVQDLVRVVIPAIRR
jgi:hypothetical protein